MPPKPKRIQIDVAADLELFRAKIGTVKSGKTAAVESANCVRLSFSVLELHTNKVNTMAQVHDSRTE
jgi:hypothetical protein